jgi:osmotically inducible protein OsmC
VAVSAACTLDEVEGAPRITTVELTVRAQVPGLDAALFEQMVGQAADLCPVSNALRGNVEISVRSELAPSVEATAKPRRKGSS